MGPKTHSVAGRHAAARPLKLNVPLDAVVNLLNSAGTIVKYRAKRMSSTKRGAQTKRDVTNPLIVFGVKPSLTPHT